MPQIDQSKLRKQDKVVLRSTKNGEVLNVIFPNGIQVGLDAKNFNYGIRLPNLNLPPAKTENVLFALGGDIYFNGLLVAPSAGSNLNIKSEGTSLTSTVASIDFTGSVFVATTAGNDVTVSATLPVTGTKSVRWDPDYSPASPSSIDDEFMSGESLDDWTTWDPGSTAITVAIDKDGLIIDQPTITGDKVAGIYKQAPTASSGDYEYSFYSKMSISTQDLTDFPGVLLFAAVDIATNPTTSKLYSLALISESAQFRAHSQIWTNYANYSATAGTRIQGATTIYGRIRVSYDSGTGDSTIGVDWSSDGLGWHQISQNTYTEQYKHIGLAVNNVQGASVVRGRFQYFRTYQDASFFLEPSGSFVRVENDDL